MVLLGILISTLDVQYLIGKIGHKMRKIGKKNQDLQSNNETTFILLLLTYF